MFLRGKIKALNSLVVRLRKDSSNSEIKGQLFRTR